jgi:hypothetical protein
MIQQDYKNNVEQVSPGIQTTGFNIEVNESMFQLLTSNIYNDPTLAVVREWSTNACDACIVAGKEVKFDVHLPTLSETYFHVRDYGTGLPPEDVTGLFSNLGASTKRESDALNGTLGIGRMAGLAVADAFTVDSYYHGKQYSYAISMQKGVPVTMYMGEADTSEPNGLKLSVSVDYSDIAVYREKAEKLYKYFDHKPNVNIENIDMDLSIKEHISDNWFIQNTGYSYTKTNYVVMSQIVYAIPESSSIEDFGFKDLVMKAPPGSVTFNPGRESLSLNKTTVAYLNKMFKEISEEYVYAATLAMAACEDDKELMACYRKVYDKAPYDLAKKIDPTPFTSINYQQLFTSRYSTGGNVTFNDVAVGDTFNLATGNELTLTHKGSYYKTSKDMSGNNSQYYYTFFDAGHVIIDLKTKFKTAINTKFDGKNLICWQRKGKTDIDEAVESAKDYLDGLGLSYQLASDIVKEAGLDVNAVVAPRDGFYASDVNVRSREVYRSKKLCMDLNVNKICLYLKLSNTTPTLTSTDYNFDEYMIAYNLLDKITPMPAIRGIAKKYQGFADSLEDWVDFETYIEETMKEATFKVPLGVSVPKFNNRIINRETLYQYPKDIQDYYTEVNNYHRYNAGDSYTDVPIHLSVIKSFGASTTSYEPTIEIDMQYLTESYPTSLEMLNSGSGHYGMPDGIVTRIATLENYHAVHSAK